MAVSSWKTHGMSAMLLVGLGSMGGLAHAEIRTLSGQFMDVTVDTAGLPSGFGDVQLIETPIQWDCTGVNCVVTGAPTASVVFRSNSGEAITFANGFHDFDLAFTTTLKPSAALTDPNGNAWGIAAVDNGKWSLQANITGQQARPKDALFATAYGQLVGYVDRRPANGRIVHPTWSEEQGFFTTVVPGFPKDWAAYSSSGSVIGLDQTGVIGWGPGQQGQSLLEPDGTNLSEGVVNSMWHIRTMLAGAYYALPSTTNPRCTELSCLSYVAGAISVDSYAFTMPIIATATAVPENGTFCLSALGLGLMAWRMRSRSATRHG